MKRILFCIGTRPEAIKLAPLILAARKMNQEAIVISTGQHRKMLDPLLEFFKLEVSEDLNVMSQDQSLAELTATVLKRFQAVLTSYRPNLVIVQGDTTTAAACALAAFYEKVTVAHVEAGLRTGDCYSPFPEEMNRTLIGDLARYHFAPTEQAKINLAKEGITKNVWVTGNTGIDALRIVTELHPVSSKEPKEKRTIVVTCHRRENHGQPLENICKAILEIVNRFSDVEVVFPVHLNPNVGATVERILKNHPQIKLPAPLDYPEFTQYLQKCSILLTDSGGIQEEAPYFKRPLFVLRDSTERPEGVQAGVAALVGSDTQKIVEQVSKALTDRSYYESFQKGVSPYGDGFASEKILEILRIKNS